MNRKSAVAFDGARHAWFCGCPTEEVSCDLSRFIVASQSDSPSSPADNLHRGWDFPIHAAGTVPI